MPLTDTILSPELTRAQPLLPQGLDPGGSAFFSTLFPALEQRGVRYCALHGREGLLYGTDFAVHGEDEGKLSGVFGDLQDAGFLPVQWLERAPGERRIVFARISDLRPETGAVDFVLGGRGTDLVAGRRREGKFWASVGEAAERGATISGRLTFWVHRLRQKLSPDGACLVFLGPDGVGKTTLLRAVSQSLQAVFPEQNIYRWRPSVFARAPRLARLPHSKPPRSLAGSISYLCFTCVDFVSGYLYAIRSLLARNGLVIFDRFYHDLLIDPKRYRYAGPVWLVRALSRVVPPRDLFFVVLDAEEATIQSRKRQLPPDEIRRQRRAYREFAAQAPASVLITTDNAFENCRAEALARFFQHLSARLAQRYPAWFAALALGSTASDRANHASPSAAALSSTESLNCENHSEFGSTTTVKMTRYKLLGVNVDAVTHADLHDVMAEAVASNQRCLIGNHNLHSVYLHHRDRHFADMYDRADCIYVDGMPIIFLAQALGLPLQREHRTTFLDSFEPLVAEIAQRNWRLFYLGSKPGVAERGAETLRKRFPGLQISTQDGYFDARPGSAENRRVLETINAFRPHVLMVGMGMPRQEYWTAENLDALSANVIITSGATMDYLAGEVPVPPRWTGPLGLYGFSRLLNEPARLWKRYLIEPWYVLGWFLRALWQIPRATRRRPVAAAKPLEEQQQAQAD